MMNSRYLTPYDILSAAGFSCTNSLHRHKNIELSIILIHEVCFVKILSLLLPVLSRSIMFSSFLHNFLQFFPLHDLISITFVLTKEKYMATLNILYEDPHILVCVKPHGIATQSKSIRYPDMVSLIKNHLTKSSGSRNPLS